MSGMRGAGRTWRGGVVLAVTVQCWAVGAGYADLGDRRADVVLGQPTLTSNAPNWPDTLPGPERLALSNAAHVALGPSGRLYVSDAENHRVLSWPDARRFVTHAPADLVIGQPDFVSNAPNAGGGVSASGLFLPQGLWVDGAGNLWVCDAFNSRVLCFNDPTSDATPGEADRVIGQPDFVSGDQNLGNGEFPASADSLRFPGRVIARGGDVWIADSGNSRVLHYALLTANKPLADRVFGQYDNFTWVGKNNDGAGNDGCCPTAANLFNVIAIALDDAGNLWAGDWLNHRLLRYNDPLTSDSVADYVLGQADFSGGEPNGVGTLGGLQLPTDLYFDRRGRLLVADAGNHRVLVYDAPTVLPLPGDVYGQLGDLTTSEINHGLGPFAADAESLFSPTGVAEDAAGNLLIVDTDNHRVLRFDARRRGNVGDGPVKAPVGVLVGTAPW